MRVGLISDVHGNALALGAVLSELAQQDVRHVLLAGDIVGYYPYVNEVIDQLQSEGVIAVLGNHDSYLLGRLPVSGERWHTYQLDRIERVIRDENRAWLAHLRTERRLELGELRFHLCHGSPWAMEEYIYPDSQEIERFAQLDVDIVVMGHTHIPMVRCVGDVLLVNPGSCGQPRDYVPGACYGILNTQDGQVSLHRTTYDLLRLIKSLQALDYPQPLIDILCRTKG